MSGSCKPSCCSNSLSSCTTATEIEKPPFRRDSATSSASSSLSSTCSTRNWPGWGTGLLAAIMNQPCQMPGILHYWRLIDDHPVQAYALHCLPELVEIDRLLDIAVGSQVVTRHQIPLFLRGGHDDDRDSLGPRITLDLFQYFHPIDLGKF